MLCGVLLPMGPDRSKIRDQTKGSSCWGRPDPLAAAGLEGILCIQTGCHGHKLQWSNHFLLQSAVVLASKLCHCCTIQALYHFPLALMHSACDCLDCFSGTSQSAASLLVSPLVAIFYTSGQNGQLGQENLTS